MKAKLPIFALASPGKPGEQFTFKGEGPLRVVRNLTQEEAKRLAPEFVALVVNRLPLNTPIYWVECRKIGKAKVSVMTEPTHELSHQQKWTIHDDPLHARVWTFRSVKQMVFLEENIMENKLELLGELQEGCFYFSQVKLDDCLFWVFLCCDDVAEDARSEVAELVRDKGGFEVIPPPDDVVEYVKQRFDEFRQKTPPGQVSQGGRPC